MFKLQVVRGRLKADKATQKHSQALFPWLTGGFLSQRHESIVGAMKKQHRETSQQVMTRLALRPPATVPLLSASLADQDPQSDPCKLFHHFPRWKNRFLSLCQQSKWVHYEKAKQRPSIFWINNQAWLLIEPLCHPWSKNNWMLDDRRKKFPLSEIVVGP